MDRYRLGGMMLAVVLLASVRPAARFLVYLTCESCWGTSATVGSTSPRLPTDGCDARSEAEMQWASYYEETWFLPPNER